MLECPLDDPFGVREPVELVVGAEHDGQELDEVVFVQQREAALGRLRDSSLESPVAQALEQELVRVCHA